MNREKQRREKVIKAEEGRIKGEERRGTNEARKERKMNGKSAGKANERKDENGKGERRQTDVEGPKRICNWCHYLRGRSEGGGALGMKSAVSLLFSSNVYN